MYGVWCIRSKDGASCLNIRATLTNGKIVSKWWRNVVRIFLWAILYFVNGAEFLYDIFCPSIIKQYRKLQEFFSF
jgi:hypothetical protein